MLRNISFVPQIKPRIKSFLGAMAHTPPTPSPKSLFMWRVKENGEKPKKVKSEEPDTAAWVKIFVAAPGLSLAAVSKGYSSLQCMVSRYSGFSCCRAWALECSDFSSCSRWALECQLSSCDAQV